MAAAGRMTETGAGDFFIPDLCAARPVFMMVLLSELLVVVFVLANSSLPGFNWNLLAAGSIFVQWIVLTSAAALCLLRKPLSRLNLQAAAATALAVILLVTLLSSLGAHRALPAVAGGDPAGWWLLRNLLVVTVLAGVVLRYFYLQQQLRQREQSELQARLDSLRTRIRPHFLFNTMNSIAALISSRPEDAEQVVEDLSELFRVSLQEHGHNATVGDELRLCDLYLRIEQVRLGEHLQISRDIDPAVLSHAMPSLILQPLVENAVYHGISRMARGGTISLQVTRCDGNLRAVVRNPVPAEGSAASGHRIAVSNIEQRLQGLYGAAAHLRSSLKNGEYRVELVYPLDAAQ